MGTGEQWKDWLMETLLYQCTRLWISWLYFFFLQPIGRGGSLEHWPIERQLHQGVNQLTCILFVQPIGRGVAVEAWANGKTTASGCESADFILFLQPIERGGAVEGWANGKTSASGCESAEYYFIFPTNRKRGSSGGMGQWKDNCIRVWISWLLFYFSNQ